MQKKSNTYKTYKETISLEERKEKYQNYKLKYPNKVPIILQQSQKCNLILLERPEVLLDENQTGVKLLQLLQEQLKEKKISIFLYCTKPDNSEIIFPVQDQLKNIAQLYKDQEDGFLYLTYTGQETLG